MSSSLKEILKEHKSKIHFIILFIAAYTIGFFFWNYLRPKILISSCSDIAFKSSQIQARISVSVDTDNNYKNLFDDCLKDIGITPSPINSQ